MGITYTAEVPQSKIMKRTDKNTQQHINKCCNHQDAADTSKFSASFSRCRNSSSSATSSSLCRDFCLRKCSMKSRSPSRSSCSCTVLAMRWNDFSTTTRGWFPISRRNTRSSRHFIGRSSSAKSTFCTDRTADATRTGTENSAFSADL